MAHSGFELYISERRHYFVVTNYKNRHVGLCKKICEILDAPVTDGNVKFIKDRLQQGEYYTYFLGDIERYRVRTSNSTDDGPIADSPKVICIDREDPI